MRPIKHDAEKLNESISEKLARRDLERLKENSDQIRGLKAEVEKTMPPTTREIQTFLNESNKIEDVFDLDSLQQAQYAWDYLMAQEKITPSVILKTHKILMLHQKLAPNEKGYFRKTPVWVGGREGMKWSIIPHAVKSWCAAVNATDPSHDPKTLHVLFEEIHPFVDGNGRTGRLLYAWSHIKRGLELHTIYAADRNAYYRWFRCLYY